ncbi:STAS domain-containing protein [Simiduia sp. 21SJ11W-1]|uniref:STAS domain-containing protein n=1 Tax=Simiduia sp. 21SJ11W-1 TaxID=2909669 RepID=UPI0020A0F791|nr:STAS domain-containing protein [Simiduia sp. 21SJ11W-1]UTA48458.1 STAS domain-containing protein [Simiduia sp. 21SJ11W-1]
MNSDFSQSTNPANKAGSEASFGADATLHLAITGRFGLDVHQAFREAYRPYVGRARRCVIDLSECTGIDSAGMAQLLILRDLLGLAQAQFLLSGSNEDVTRLLGYANFDQLFTVIPR